MAKAKTTAPTKFAVKKAQLEILERFTKILDDMKSESTTDYRVVGKETEQATHWKTGELLWEDEEMTIPKYRDRYATVELSENELSDEQKAMLTAIDNMIAELDKMV